jgi:Smr domain-containing protein
MTGTRRLVGRVVALPLGHDERTIRLDPGPLAVTLTVVGLPLAELPVGTRLRVGSTARLELAPGGPGGLREELDGESCPARVIDGGPIQLGDAVVLEAVVLPLEDALDLHAFRPDEVADVVREYLARAQAAGLVEVRLIHGRGQGVQRETVRRVLAASPIVTAFFDAPPERGGWGATVARLGPPAAIPPSTGP